MAGDDTGKAHRLLAENTPGPDVMLGLWASWMDQMSTSVRRLQRRIKPWWEMTVDAPFMTSSPVGTSSSRRVCRRIRHCAPSIRCGTPIHCERSSLSIGLKSPGRCGLSGSALSGNPGRPRPWWTSIRTCGARRCRSGRRPDSAGWASGFVGRRQSARSPDKRFAAPEWHTNPAYRTLKEVYLLASDWLLKQSDADDDLDRPSGSASTSICASSTP